MEYCEIPLNRGMVSLVDICDFDIISKKNWCIQRDYNTFYAVSAEPRVNGKQEMIKMHRFILGLHAGDEKTVDHINRNGLDNRRCNLRIVTRSINAYNRRIHKNNTSGYRGVTVMKRDNHWYAFIQEGNVKKYLGSYKDKESAARAYDMAAITLYGKDAILNFPKIGG